jgi:hypothetical protein
MNNDDLERQLRAQAGPREHGYVPTRLPASLDEAPSARRASPLMRAAFLLPAAAAGILVVAVAGAILTGSIGNGNANVGGDATAEPTATTTPSAGQLIACVVDDLTFVAEPWGGAAGSRGTVVTVSLKDGRPDCNASTGVSGRIVDANGTVLVGSIRFGMRFPDVVIHPGEQFTIGVAWSNWCGDPPARPLSLELKLDDIREWVTVSEPVSEPTSLPPCMGEGSPGNLSVTALQPAN